MLHKDFLAYYTQRASSYSAFNSVSGLRHQVQSYSSLPESEEKKKKMNRSSFSLLLFVTWGSDGRELQK